MPVRNRAASRLRCCPGKKRRRSVDPDGAGNHGLAPVSLGPGTPQEKRDEIPHRIPGLDHECTEAQRAYLSPPPSSFLLDPTPPVSTTPLDGMFRDPGPPTRGTRARERDPDPPRKRKTCRLERLCIAEVLRRADRYERKLHREAKRVQGVRKEEGERGRREDRPRAPAA